MVSSDLWDEATAATYDDDVAGMASPEVLGPTLERLVELADGGPVLELAAGTGRIAVPLLRRGLAVSGIELSEPMAARLQAKLRDGERVPVVIGDMAEAAAEGAGSFRLVVLVFNSISNLRTQDEQVACFRNAARHLAPGGRFVLELEVPPLRRLPIGQTAVPFDVSEEHTGFDTIDVATQELSSHHYTRMPDGSYRYGVGHFRYIWPAECDLMAQLAGLEPESRHAGWDGEPFTADSTSHVSVWRKPS